MDLKRPKRLKALNRLWGNVQIAEEYFQKAPEGNSINAPKYKALDFNSFDSSASMCTNLNIFAENARQFFESFVNLDDHEKPKRTLKKWHKMADKISRISEKIKTNKSLVCHKWKKENGEYEYFWKNKIWINSLWWSIILLEKAEGYFVFLKINQ